MQRAKISLIGSGNIGGTLAQLIAMKELADVTMLDLHSGIPQGKSLDIAQSSAIEGFANSLYGSKDYSTIANSDVIIVTAGLPRKPGMSRDDLLEINAKIIKEVALGIKEYSPNAFVIVITNPLDAMVYVMQKSSGLPHHKVVGMAGELDSARFKYFLSKELDIAIKDIKAMVMGGHGDTMVPLKRFTSVSGIPLKDIIKMGWMSEQKLDDIIERTRNGGGEIVSLLEKGSAFYAPASAAISMAKAYINGSRTIFSCATWLKKEYNVKDLYVGVPAIIGDKGVDKVLELELEPKEQEMFNKSVKAVKDIVQKVQNFI